jgi:hypothetical protein
MKRVDLWMIGIGLFITVGLLTVKPGYAEEKEHEPMCSNKTIKGEYGFSYSGEILGYGPIVGVAMFSFDGHGNMSLLDHTLINGLPQSAPFARFSSGTYTVKEIAPASSLVTCRWREIRNR